jgi:hypothetical protein
MPTEAVAFLAAIIVAFGGFAVVLAWANHRTG